MKSADIRQSFFDFFESKGHEIVPSSPVVLPSDPTLLFANAGMNQFKDIFLGARTPESKRVADTQKCIRVSGKHNDLEEVGRDTYHHTFFEMLGNWSFGDYTKREAIAWAWELLTDTWGLDKHRLWATVFREDDDAEALWREVTDIDPSHIARFDEKDNFWEMGETGPCGPCSEIHYDATPDAAGGALVNAGSPEVIEIWNLVFIQYNRRADGTLEELRDKHIDTGMGFERICAVLQGKASNYDTDLFLPLIRGIEDLAGRAYGADSEDDVAMRVISDHLRTLAFAIADGVLPSNEGRGYVLRRLLRRAVRFGRNLGFREPFLSDLLPALQRTMGGVFPELEKNAESIRRSVQAEERSFLATLDRGLALFEEYAASAADVFPADQAFQLYDTYGFPFDLTALMARERGLTVDERGFEQRMEAQRQRGRQARDSSGQNRAMDLIADLTARGLSSRFAGYEREQTETRILAVAEDGSLLLEETPFYAESGGQMGDRGVIEGEGGTFVVDDTQKPAEGIILHRGRLTRGELRAGDAVRAAIDHDRRAALRRHHTATHLLNEALRRCVDSSIRQAGSHVAPDRLRFDFNHYEALTPDQVRDIERFVTRCALRNEPVSVREMALKEVQKDGSIQALFDEKYGETVRVVEVRGISRELCGGTHVSATGEIGPFRILSESSISAGVRRIEAAAGEAALAAAQEDRALLQSLSRELAVPPEALPERVAKLQRDLKAAEKERKRARLESNAVDVEALASRAQRIAGLSVLAAFVGEMPMDSLLGAMDRLAQSDELDVLILGATSEDKGCLACRVSGAGIGRGLHAGQLIGAVARKAGGGGGGQPDKAQAGTKEGRRIPDALNAAPEILREALGG
jgi:alanyl-tRNA synthetase